MTEDRVRLRLKKGEVEAEAEGPRAFVEEIRKYFDGLAGQGLELTVGALPITSSRPPMALAKPDAATTSKPESLAELLDRLPSKGHIDKILIFGYHLERNKKMPSFAVGDINQCYGEVKEKPSNTAQFLAMATQRGLVMRAPDQPGGATRYVLTRRGEQQVDAALAAS